MLLENLMRNPSEYVEYMQRYVNNLSPSGYHTTPPGRYNPRSASVPFNIPYFKIKIADPVLLHLRTSSVTPLDDFVYSENTLHFFVHPLLLDTYGDALLDHTIDKRIH